MAQNENLKITAAELETYKYDPKSFFASRFRHFMDTADIPSQADVNAIATRFCQQKIEAHVATKDILRRRVYSHVLHHQNISVCAWQMYYLYTIRDQVIFFLAENAFIRGSRLHREIENCQQCIDIKPEDPALLMIRNFTLM